MWPKNPISGVQPFSSAMAILAPSKSGLKPLETLSKPLNLLSTKSQPTRSSRFSNNPNLTRVVL